MTRSLDLAEQLVLALGWVTSRWLSVLLVEHQVAALP
jgi:hypothetical protein